QHVGRRDIHAGQVPGRGEDRGFETGDDEKERTGRPRAAAAHLALAGALLLAVRGTDEVVAHADGFERRREILRPLDGLDLVVDDDGEREAVLEPVAAGAHDVLVRRRREGGRAREGALLAVHLLAPVLLDPRRVRAATAHDRG